VAVIVLFPTRFSEFTIPKTLAAVNFEAKSFKLRYNRFYVIYGNDDIVTVDAYPTIERFNIFLGKRSVELSLYPQEDYRTKGKSFKRETQSWTHRRELRQASNAMSRYISLPGSTSVNSTEKSAVATK
jgi:hypothetical protein